MAGVDEAGRGPLAGPVCAAACIVPLDCSIEGIHDSKKLSEAQRETLYSLLTTDPRISWSTCIIDAARIDEINILEASMEAMTVAVERLAPQPNYVLVDGPYVPKQMSVPAKALVKGDSRCYSIAAASIIAKVTRDRLMNDYSKQYPEFGFDQHKVENINIILLKYFLYR